MPDFADLQGRVAVVTGGASGIGLGLARALKREGATVVLADIEVAPLAAAAEALSVLGVQTDVSRAEDVDALAAGVLDRFGRVDIVCNNAGVAPKVRIQDATLQDWRWMVDVNLWGVIHGVHAFLPHLLENPAGGWIVNTASAGGFVTGPMIGTYCVTKAGVVALSEALSIELKMQQAEVGVTILAPGTVRTNLHTSARNRPEALDDTHARDIDLKQAGALPIPQRWITPDSVGRVMIEALRCGALYAPTHPDLAHMFEARAGRILKDLRAPIPPTTEVAD